MSATRNRNAIRLGLLAIVPLAIAVFLVAQLVPYGRSHANPAGQLEPQWDSPQTRALAVRACFDCHSNETVWPWYSNVAPISWLIQHDVNEGREHLNFSEWNRSQRESRESSREVQNGRMPPFYYVWLHPSAGLSVTERAGLVQGLQATLGSATGQEGGERRRD